ncbi:MAG TPA: DUF4124 domain-containing protein [Steroidobacter sp.]|uniref:DUF4124 domain-containing protein n=1 Tax=Steroidobacter sp. TaxID=1978227 RepID=UPI002ED8CD32
MRTALYVLLALAVPAFAGQTVYKWVDDQGVTHYSDQPVAGAEKVELSGGTKRASTPAPTYSPPAREVTTKGPVYSRFVVESPQQDQAIINTGGVVRVSLASTPAINSGHVVSLYLDGSPVEGYSGAMSHELTNVPRGTHTVKAVVSTQQGQKIQETPVVTFHVRQESAAQPPVGPALRNNKPKRTAGNKMPTKQPTYAALNGDTPAIDPRTNMPVVKPAKPTPAGPKAGK